MDFFVGNDDKSFLVSETYPHSVLRHVNNLS